MKDRIRLVQDYAQLTQQDFANYLEISPASLSSIYTGRTQPTSKHVMAIHKAFPEINVNWLMFGEGEMKLNSGTSEGHDEGVSSSPNNSVPGPQNAQAPVGDLFSSMSSEPVTEMEGIQPSARGYSDPQNGTAGGRYDMPSGPRNTGKIVNTTLHADKAQRRIKEIRVFFSDGTYESFVPANK